LYKYTLLISIVLFTACDINFLYEKKIELTDNQWTYDNPLVYDFEIEDTVARYNIFLEIEHTPEFPFQNLYTKIYTTYPTGRTIESQISIDLADKTGKWYGKCGSEDCLLRVGLQQNTFFKEIGKHQIVFEQYTRQEAVKGLNSIAFLLQKQAK